MLTFIFPRWLSWHTIRSINKMSTVPAHSSLAPRWSPCISQYLLRYSSGGLSSSSSSSLSSLSSSSSLFLLLLLLFFFLFFFNYTCQTLITWASGSGEWETAFSDWIRKKKVPFKWSSSALRASNLSLLWNRFCWSKAIESWRTQEYYTSCFHFRFKLFINVAKIAFIAYEHMKIR